MTCNHNVSTLKVKQFLWNLPVKIMLYTAGVAMVLTLVVSAIPFLFIYLPVGGYSIAGQD